MRTNKPVSKDTVVVDLYDGHRYVVLAVYPAKATDREWSTMPETVMHAWPAGAVTDDELSALREKTKYAPQEFGGPFEDVVFFSSNA
jgi:hypothetical protein